MKQKVYAHGLWQKYETKIAADTPKHKENKSELKLKIIHNFRTPNKMNVWTNCHSERSEESGFCCKYQAFHFAHCFKYLILLDALSHFTL